MARWRGVTSGAERATYTVNVDHLCAALDLLTPGIAAGGTLADFPFEGPVPGGSLKDGPGFIDVYRHGHLIPETKQSKPVEKLHAGATLTPAEEWTRVKRGHGSCCTCMTS